MNAIRNNWTLDELEDMYKQPLFTLVSQAHNMHANFHCLGEVQICTLLSIKTGGCTEDCKYCAQSVRYQTNVSATPMMQYEEVLESAKKARTQGATRFCLGVGWREVRDGRQFDSILQMIKGITALGLEVCCTLGMLKEHHAQALKDAGLYAYSHNLDTSAEYYNTIITTRTYQDRLNTLDILEKIGISVCCGGILGLGESITDRLKLLQTLSARTPHPDSVPINKLTPIPGTPLQDQPMVSTWEMLRIISIARIIMPKCMLRLSAGRSGMSFEEQALYFFAGANSIHMGEKLLTVGNASVDKDEEMFALLDLQKRPGFIKGQAHG